MGERDLHGGEWYGVYLGPVDVLAALPWPNVRGKRCLAIAPDPEQLATELWSRGAREVVALRPDGKLVDVLAAHDQFDVVVAGQVLAPRPEPAAVASALRGVTRGVLVSWEPIDLVLSLVGRGRALFTLGPDGVGFNGSGHRHVLELAGFAIERVSKPFVLGPTAAESIGRRLALRALTGSSDGGELHRALLARPILPD